MAASRTKAPAVGSKQWVYDERQQATELVNQELEDFNFSVRNDLEWLNEHMTDIFANNGQNNLDVFKTPGKLRGKTPRTARKKNAPPPRQPLGDIFSANAQNKPSPAQHSLKENLQKHAIKTKFHVAEDFENTAPVRSPIVPAITPRALFAQPLNKGKENRSSPLRGIVAEEEITVTRVAIKSPARPAPWSPKPSTQDTVMSSQDDTQIFTQEATQLTQPTQPTQSMRRSLQLSEDERRDTGDSFVSAKEALGSRGVSHEDLRGTHDEHIMEVDDEQPREEQHAKEQSSEPTTAIHNSPQYSTESRVISDAFSIDAETHDVLDTENKHAYDPEPKNLVDMFPVPLTGAQMFAEQPAQHDDTVLHHDVEDEMDMEDEDARSPSDGSSPVKPLVRKSSLTFASLPAREPLLAKKSMGNRVSRTSHLDQTKGRSSQMGRFTGGKSLGGSQQAFIDLQADAMDVDNERPTLVREESQTTKLHNSTSTKSLKERLNMLNQRNEPPKMVGQTAGSSHTSQPQSMANSQVTQPPQPTQASQPSYPQLPSGLPQAMDDDEEDDWISPIRPKTAPKGAARPPLNKAHSADTRTPISTEAVVPKSISVSNPNLSTVVESTTPAGSPTSRRNMDGAMSASKAKLYSAFRAAKEKIIGSSAASAQAKLDALAESSTRPKLQTNTSLEDIFTSPKRNVEKTGNGIFSHLRSPSKESLRPNKQTATAMPESPGKGDGRRTRSSSERERQKEKDLREKMRTEDRLREMRDKEQYKAAAHYQKAKAVTKTPAAAAAPPANSKPVPASLKTPVATAQAPQPRPGTSRTMTAPRQQDLDASEEMPPPPPPKSQLPTGTGHKSLREPKRLVKPQSKETLPRGKPQSIRVNLHPFGQAPKTTTKPAPPAAARPAPAAAKPAPAAPRPAPVVSSKPIPAPKFAPPAPKAAPRMAKPQPPRVVEKSKATPAQPRADLGAARSVSRLQTVQDANRINIPQVNPAKPPPKRPFQGEHDETIHRPAKRPSQQARSKPVTPAHAQFAQGKIPFAEPAQPAQPTVHYPNGEDIKLPDIMTDSEDEDSENEFEAPDWVNTPNLREMLASQQLLDPEQIFGPIAPLNMEQVFPNKERHKRFRDRTSSAYWANDQVTEAEKQRVREAQERLVREGGWTYNPSPRPGAPN